MTSLDVRGNSAVMKRAEQLKRWEESDTNRAPATPRSEHGRKIKFSSGCVFLAACLAGDKEEVLKLIQQGADINTANVDGLTALHQACIDDNLEMVEFLVENGADINRQDNEGWTPLHATASCGFVSIARYLVEHGADVAAVNSDGDLALDLALDIQHLPMIDFMQKMVNEHNIDCEKARQAEEQQMLMDAKRWLRSDASEVDRPHPKTGATALHVAAAKGYTKVLSLLLAGRANVDKQDNDGWTPLHAAAHWSQKEAAEMLVDAMADVDLRNYGGQTCIDVADRKMVKFLEELRAMNKRKIRRPSSQISSRISDTIENHHIETPTKIIRVELKPDQSKDQANDKQKTATIAQNSAGSTAADDDAPWRRNSSTRSTRLQNDSPTKNQVPDIEASKSNAAPDASDVILRRTQSFEHDEKFYQKYTELRARIKANSCPILPASQIGNSNLNNNNNNNNNSSNNNNNNNNCNSNSINTSVLGTANNSTTSSATTNITSAIATANTTTTTSSSNQNYSVQRSASLKDHRNFRKPPASPTINSQATPSTGTTSSVVTPRRSFVPPVRDEESETQRKAHAKRVRETRRSTQGVTLDEIKSAEELVKKKNSTMNNNNNSTSFKLEDASSGGTYPPNNSTIIPSAPAVLAAAASSQRRINSVGNQLNASNQSLNSIGRPVSAPMSGGVGGGSTTSLTANLSGDTTSSVERIGDSSASYTPVTAAGRRISSLSSSSNVSTNTTPTTTVAAATSTASAEANKSNEDKDNDKENENRATLASQAAVLQRRRKPKRRSTGVVHLDMDDLDPDRQDSTNDADDKEKESGSERTSRSRLGSNTSSAAASSSSATDDKKSRDKSENGDGLDYKALWEAAKLENDKLKQQLKKKDDEVAQTRSTLERYTNATSKNSLSEIEKRERRAMERKFSEMEEELKLLQKLKTENERLRAENRALTRVVSKLTTSAQSQLSKSK